MPEVPHSIWRRAFYIMEKSESYNMSFDSFSGSSAEFVGSP